MEGACGAHSVKMRHVFGLDQKIASLASGKPLMALVVALLLGLRHPLDPDHLAAVGAMARAPGVDPR
jgi:high-affinity nickel permease